MDEKQRTDDVNVLIDAHVAQACPSSFKFNWKTHQHIYKSVT